MKTLLVAVSEEDRDQVATIAAQEFRVYVASSLNEASSMLCAEGLDGMVCCVGIKEDDPFAYLKLLRAHPGCQSLPFIVVREKRGALQEDNYRAIETACAEQGIPYLDSAAYARELGEEAGHAELRRRIETLLGPPA